VLWFNQSVCVMEKNVYDFHFDINIKNYLKLKKKRHNSCQKCRKVCNGLPFALSLSSTMWIRNLYNITLFGIIILIIIIIILNNICQSLSYLKNKLTSKVVKEDPKIIISLISPELRHTGFPPLQPTHTFTYLLALVCVCECM